MRDISPNGKFVHAKVYVPNQSPILAAGKRMNQSARKRL